MTDFTGYDETSIQAAGFLHKTELNDSGMVLYHTATDRDRFEFVITQDTETGVHPVVQGEGYLGLRELRHTWWGRYGCGYVYYPDRVMFSRIFDALSKWFDV